MTTTMYIPETIKVGFQKREDTYTKYLAYIIYYDEKKKLRKETSWQKWRDSKIEPQDHLNIPTEGFVLNKKVGDYSTSFGHRQSMIRVYDPRGFEFEITSDNLLYILDFCQSEPGKGLSGKFVYAWEGTELILLPEQSPDYQTLKAHSEVIQSNQKIGAKDLVVGHEYLNKKGESFIYVGKYKLKTYKHLSSCNFNASKQSVLYSESAVKDEPNKKAEHIFYTPYKKKSYQHTEPHTLKLNRYFEEVKSISSKFVTTNGPTTLDIEYILEEFQKDVRVNSLDYSQTVSEPMSFEKFEQMFVVDKPTAYSFDHLLVESDEPQPMRLVRAGKNTRWSSEHNGQVFDYFYVQVKRESAFVNSKSDPWSLNKATTHQFGKLKELYEYAKPVQVHIHNTEGLLVETLVGYTYVPEEYDGNDFKEN